MRRSSCGYWIAWECLLFSKEKNWEQGFKPSKHIGRSVFEVYRAVPQILKDCCLALSGEGFTLIVVVKGDARLLRLVLENLLGNAWKYTSKHSHARVEFGIIQQNGKPVYFVRDDGAGFDVAYADKLFGVFQRLHAVTDFTGTGIA
jgi:light-regulated signal transduction histidine kinase (bacteriophytochrome)